MGFKSFLSAVGHAPLVVLKYLNTPQGQKTVQIAEGAAVMAGTAFGGAALGAGIASVEALLNKGIAGVLGMEANAAVIGAQSGTGAQKGTAVAAALIPQAQQLLKDLGYENPTEDQIFSVAVAVSSGLANIINSIPPPAALVSPVVAVDEVAAAAKAAAAQQGMVSR
jgi:hypothetical protein